MTNIATSGRIAARRTWVKPEVRQFAAGAAEVSTRMRAEADSAFTFS